jgi:MYXO-CTERM domain-containing protein
MRTLEPRQASAFVAGTLASLTCLLAANAGAETLKVGPGATYAMPCQAFAAAKDGDSIEIDALGNYAGDVCAIVRNELTIRGVGSGRAKIDAAGKNALGKGIWVVQGDATSIENIEFSGASVPDMNGAGIRQEGRNLNVRRCFFHDNQNGILAGDALGSEILIESSEFDRNGAGDGYSHNLYINHVARLVFRYNYSHRALVGHLLKTRAAENHILYNRLSGEAEGTQSYELDVPNGGLTYVIGNVIEQGPKTQNPGLFAFFMEGAHAANPSHSLFVVNNTFVNRLGRGSFLLVGATATTPPVVYNNIFSGTGTPPPDALIATSHNYTAQPSCFVDAEHDDFRLAPGTPCIDAGAELSNNEGFSLMPREQYLHPAAHEPRPVVGVVDVGAYEYAPEGTGGASANGGSANGGGLGKGGAANGGAANGGSANGGSANGGAAVTAGTGSAGLSAGEPSGPTDSKGGGCSCRTRASSEPLALPLISLLGWLVWRRRRSTH